MLVTVSCASFQRVSTCIKAAVWLHPQAKIKDVSAGGGGGINKVAPGGNSTAGSQYYSPYAPPAVPSTP